MSFSMIVVFYDTEVIVLNGALTVYLSSKNVEFSFVHLVLGRIDNLCLREVLCNALL